MLKASQSAVKPTGLALCVFCAMRTAATTPLVRRTAIRYVHNSSNSGNSSQNWPGGAKNPYPSRAELSGFQRQSKSPFGPSAPPNKWAKPTTNNGEFSAPTGPANRGRNPNQMQGAGLRTSKLDNLFGLDGEDKAERGNQDDSGHNNQQYSRDGNAGYGGQQPPSASNQYSERQPYTPNGGPDFTRRPLPFQSPQSNAQGFGGRQPYTPNGGPDFARKPLPFQSPQSNVQGHNQYPSRQYGRDTGDGNAGYTGQQQIFRDLPKGGFTQRPPFQRDDNRASPALRDHQFGRRPPYPGSEEVYRYPSTPQRFDGTPAAPVEKLPTEYISTRQRVSDPAYEKRQISKQREKERNRRGFDDTESAILEEYEEELTGKAARKAKKAKKKQKVVDDSPKMIPLFLPEYISVANLASALKVKLEDFMKQMVEMGFEDVHHDHILNTETAGLIAMEYNFEPIVDKSESIDLVPRTPPEDKSALPPRPPVVTIMGHVDHGKTTILDWLRKSSIVDQEHGGITQHIGAFSVTLQSGQNITFLDTPGHEAFLSMRERGANVTDIVILVVAADDSVKPQTIEAIKHAKSAKVPIIVAVNKIDKEEADVERVKGDLARYGIEVEDYGGDTQVVPVSGKTGQGMADLEEATVLLSEILDMRAETDGPCEGWVLEAMTKKRGRVATVLVRRGTLKPGNIIVAGQTWAKVRTLVNEHGVEVTHASPGTPVEVDGWRDQPLAGDLALQAESEDKAKDVVAFRQEKAERLRQAADMEAINEQRKLLREKGETDNAIRAQAALLGENPENAVLANDRNVQNAKPRCSEVSFVIKADVSGSAEAVVNAISAVGNDEVRTKIIRASFGPVTEFDIDHAAAAGGYVLAFNLSIDQPISQYAREKKVVILDHNIIYHLIDDVKSKLSERLAPNITTRVTGEAEIAQVFNINIKKKMYKAVAGCKVKNGLIKRNSKVKVLRDTKVVYDGTLSSLKNVQRDVTEMKKDTECGIGFEEWDSFEVGDKIQCYEEISVPRSL